MHIQMNLSRKEAFSEKMIEMLNQGALALMVSIGHRTGLFDAMAQLGRIDIPALATFADLNERYVREWLGAMVTGGIVDYDETVDRYELPPEHAAWMTRAAAPNNLATIAQHISGLACVEDQVVECFKHGGGVPYSAFHRFQDVMAEDSEQTTVSALFDFIIPMVEGLNEKLEQGIRVLDVGCGKGLAMITMAERYPNSAFMGYDFSTEGIEKANREAQRRGLENVSFYVQDAASFDHHEQFDMITTFDAVHDQADPARVLSNIREALKTGGVYLMQDIRASKHVHKNIENPLAPFMYTISCMHCMTVSLACGGAGLGACWGEETAMEMLHNAGFSSVDLKTSEHDIQNNYYIVRK